MTARIIRIDVTSMQISRLRHEVLSNQTLSIEQRRKAARRVLPLPGDGSRVDLYCEGEFVGAV